MHLEGSTWCLPLSMTNMSSDFVFAPKMQLTMTLVRTVECKRNAQFLTRIYSLYICLQELRIISFSVVNMTENWDVVSLIWGIFLAWLETFIQKNQKKGGKMLIFNSFFATTYVFLIRRNDSLQNKLLKIRILRTDIWD